MKLTTPKIRALKWIADRGKPTAILGPEAPTPIMRTRLLDDGLIEPYTERLVGFVQRYVLTQAGRDALANLPTKGRSKPCRNTPSSE